MLIKNRWLFLIFFKNLSFIVGSKQYANFSKFSFRSKSKYDIIFENRGMKSSNYSDLFNNFEQKE